MFMIRCKTPHFTEIQIAEKVDHTVVFIWNINEGLYQQRIFKKVTTIPTKC